jgi:hypothetical protein
MAVLQFAGVESKHAVAYERRYGNQARSVQGRVHPYSQGSQVVATVHMHAVFIRELPGHPSPMLLLCEV